MAAWEAQYSMDQMVQALRDVGMHDAAAGILGAVGMAESGGVMTINRSPAETPPSLRGVDRCLSAGPWQINYCPTRDAGTIREQAARSPDLELHARAAQQVYRQQGATAWTRFTDGEWEKHKQAALDALEHADVASGKQADSSIGFAVSDTLKGPWAAFREIGAILGDPRRLGYLLLGTAVAGVGVLLIVKEASPAGIAAGAALDTVKAAT